MTHGTPETRQVETGTIFVWDLKGWHTATQAETSFIIWRPERGQATLHTGRQAEIIFIIWDLKGWHIARQVETLFIIWSLKNWLTAR